MRPSKAKAIKKKCRSCIYDPLAEGTWLMQVSACTCVSCPLWCVRPVTGSLWSDGLIQSVADTLRLTEEKVREWASNPMSAPF